MLGASSFCCLLFVSVTVYHHPAKHLSQLCPYVLYSLHVFPEEASSEIAYIFLFPLPCIYCDIFMALWFCISVLDWLDILQVFPDTFRCSKWYSQSCSTSPHSGWIPGNVCLAQCPIAVAKSSDNSSHVSTLISNFSLSWKLPDLFFQCFFFLLPFCSMQIISECSYIRMSTAYFLLKWKSPSN